MMFMNLSCLAENKRTNLHKIGVYWQRECEKAWMSRSGRLILKLPECYVN